ncbi:hypothetical protein OIO90_005530 [Microbotryomycetes sp. JL221]|nr:hypothetical protein OIO90_005530 [Microbotryomycetes sp. JL221]
MRLVLEPTKNCLSNLINHQQINTDNNRTLPPLTFIDDEPFLIELQGTLDHPITGSDPSMNGVVVGKLDLDMPSKPILKIAHHRLEGKLVTLTEPLAILRTTPRQTLGIHDEDDDCNTRVTKRLKQGTTQEKADAGNSDDVNHVRNTTPLIEIVGLVRKKIVFSKRPEPLIELSSDAPVPPSSEP